MPELPEVETTKNIIQPIIKNQKIRSAIIHQSKLRWPIPSILTKILPNKTFTDISRRGKYLLLATNAGTIIIHLGMTGCLKHVPKNIPLVKHDHFEIILKSGVRIRYNDPRKFGCVLWTEEPALEHRLLKKLGPEPLTTDFNTRYLLKKCVSKKPIKIFLMDNAMVVGVGNIYAREALFAAKILPTRETNTITKDEAKLLVSSIKKILKKSIKAGGTTLKDFFSQDGNPGYFKQELMVYGRKDEGCYICDSILKIITLGQRTTMFCPTCQK